MPHQTVPGLDCFGENLATRKYKMFGLLSQQFTELSAVRRLIFALVHLPEDLPNLWEIAISFSTGKQSSVSSSDIKLLIENLKEIDAAAFTKDDELLQELMSLPSVKSSKPLGLVFLSKISSCPLCNKSMLIRKDRPARLVVYDDKLGSVPGSHYHRYCPNREVDTLSIMVIIPRVVPMRFCMITIGNHFHTSCLQGKLLFLCIYCIR